jgi:lambda repressor-like predicted transcriptional regulator
MHDSIRGNVRTALGSRSLRWLSHQARVPYATLQAQMSNTKLSVDVLIAVASALDVSVADLVPSRGLPDSR